METRKAWHPKPLRSEYAETKSWKVGTRTKTRSDRRTFIVFQEVLSPLGASVNEVATRLHSMTRSPWGQLQALYYIFEKTQLLEKVVVSAVKNSVQRFWIHRTTFVPAVRLRNYCRKIRNFRPPPTPTMKPNTRLRTGNRQFLINVCASPDKSRQRRLGVSYRVMVLRPRALRNT